MCRAIGRTNSVGARSLAMCGLVLEILDGKRASYPKGFGRRETRIGLGTCLLRATNVRPVRFAYRFVC